MDIEGDMKACAGVFLLPGALRLSALPVRVPSLLALNERKQIFLEARLPPVRLEA